MTKTTRIRSSSSSSSDSATPTPSTAETTATKLGAAATILPAVATPKSVKFDTAPAPAPALLPTSPLKSSSSNNNIDELPIKRRRSSIKSASIPTPIVKHTYQHSDPLIRRLRLRHHTGEAVHLSKEFDANLKVVCFLFGAWSGSTSVESYSTIERFSERYSDRVKIIYVSIDATEEDFLTATSRRRYWTSLEYNDGSSATNDRADLSISPPVEPYLLATEVDLESEISDATIYCRPFSRVYLAEKFQVFGVPQLVVYSLEKEKVLTRHARMSQLKGDKGEATLECWEKGESNDFGFADFVHALRWTLAAGVLVASYVLATRLGGFEDSIASFSKSFIESSFGKLS